MKTYPLVGDYKQAITEPESFATLSFLSPCYVDKSLYFATGGPAVVFKMKNNTTGEHFAIKCFIKEQPSRQRHFEHVSQYLQSLGRNPYFVHYTYIEQELWVNDAEYPVLQMPWIEGKTLSQTVAELCQAQNSAALQGIANQFDKMALWLLEQEMAHGDIKPDNIIVTPHNTLILVDYDGMFVPSLAGAKSPELGTAEYRHPKRTSADFNRHLDDFPILVLSLSLHALAHSPDLYAKAGSGDALLFTAADLKNLLLSPKLSFFQDNAENAVLFSRFSMLMTGVMLDVCALTGLQDLLKLTAEGVIEMENVFFEQDGHVSTEYDLVVDGAWIDSLGAQYSANRRKLFKVPISLAEYDVREGTKSICDDAFHACTSLKSVTIPHSVKAIGAGVFFDCASLKRINIPRFVTSIADWTFSDCQSLENIIIPNSIVSIGDWAFSDCTSLLGVEIPNSVTSIGENAFCNCRALTSVHIPASVTSIGASAFEGCYSLANIIVSNHVTSIGDGVFWNCRLLTHIKFPNAVTSIGAHAFAGCHHLTRLTLPNSVTSIGDNAFYHCKSLIHIELPDSVTSIGAGAFEGCTSLESITIPSGVETIHQNTFKGCTSLRHIKIPDSVKMIGQAAFRGCSSLAGLVIPDSVQVIEWGGF